MQMVEKILTQNEMRDIKNNELLRSHGCDMNTNDLLRQLLQESSQFQIKDIEAKLFEIQKIRSVPPLPMHRLLIYNYETFLELHRISPGSESIPVKVQYKSY
jgi:hypothetical protein